MGAGVAHIGYCTGIAWLVWRWLVDTPYGHGQREADFVPLITTLIPSFSLKDGD
jgi:hypothetical protein